MAGGSAPGSAGQSLAGVRGPRQGYGLPAPFLRDGTCSRGHESGERQKWTGTSVTFLCSLVRGPSGPRSGGAGAGGGASGAAGEPEAPGSRLRWVGNRQSLAFFFFFRLIGSGSGKMGISELIYRRAYGISRRETGFAGSGRPA